ncbi:NADH-quinone oxidoreductase subunit L [Streptomyces filamentosus]|uniref:NADH-quinone oxidoreductase subunit L n=2 Tax=Streptomyces filamentosus TaxID=67294 RepID=A0ABY4UZ53_STRFL|nr:MULTISPECIES: NADH-quinone oxidoreductase subunit L [Streptomyces]MYR80817.1 NADH-quinone oxidoreductase subunit L [Streptomyces sp. SID5466]EFE76852.1 NADH dehydrogenase I chain L [Streptomyces filamentosus NRRL 15998]ESU48911.1 putative NADH dehydrogenase chain L [Streptomyces sp. HCCB10043]EWS93820.1 NADH dehydrogenase subunit NuoL2 [Streptomyces filamentosus NRRL 11379]USC47684.1 NADH-quinone oxidoreductase subunit L [Streptomyces filamentosus]
MTTTTLAALVPLLPFLGALAGLAVGRTAPGFVRPLAILPTLTAAVLAVLVAVRQGGGRAIDAATQLTPTGSVPIDLALHLDGFAVLVAVLVTVVATCVQLYSTAYLRDDARYPSYAALVSLFTSAMLLVVYSGDLMVLLVGWEIMGICSYFLVGHYWETPEARAASLKAFLVTKLGDVPFLIGLFALAADTGSFRITKILAAVANGGLEHPTLIALLLLAGVAGKSAQFPLHTWLPDAMAGPTPVSALIHAATMVAAGIYFVARLLPVFAASGAALVVLAVMAAVTMVGSGLAALAQDDIKRVLAYSTIGQLGYMSGALAVGDRGAAVFHLISHGAFKAVLFLAAGVVIHAAGTNSLAAMSRMSGLARRIPDAYWTMTVALLALAAIPPFAGFFSKEAVLVAAEHTALGDRTVAPAAAGWTILIAGLLAAVLTASYAVRLWLLAFRGRGAEVPDHGKQPLAMTSVLWILTIPTIGFGLTAGMLGDWFDGHGLTPSLTTAVLSTGVTLVGGLVTYGAWRHTTALAARTPIGAVAAHPGAEPALVEAEAMTSHTAVYGTIADAPDPADPGRLLLGPLHRHAVTGFHLDALYTALFVRPVRAAARLVRFLDREVVDTYVNGTGSVTRLLGTAVRRAQTGNVQTYVSALLAGSLALAIAAVVFANVNAGS